MCTSSPEHGKAFCREHCLLFQDQAPEVPTGLKDFLKYCGASQAGKHCALVIVHLHETLIVVLHKYMCVHSSMLRNALYMHVSVELAR